MFVWLLGMVWEFLLASGMFGSYQGLLAGVGISAGSGLANFSWCRAWYFSWFWLGIFG